MSPSFSWLYGRGKMRICPTCAHPQRVVLSDKVTLECRTCLWDDLAARGADL